PMIGKDELEIWPNGERRWSNSSKMPWHNAEGKIMGTFGVSFDITQRKNAEEALLISESRLKEAQQIGKIGSFEYNVHTKEFYWSDEIYRFFGAEPGKGPLTMDIMLNQLHPASKSIFEENLKLMLSGKTYLFKDSEILIIDKQNKQHFIQTRINVIKNTDGHVTRYSGTFQDITERKYAEMALQESRRNLAEANKMLKLIINSIPIRVYWKSKDSVFIGCNMRFAEDAGFSSTEEVTGKTDNDMPWKEQAEIYQNDDQEIMKNDRPKINIEEKRIISQEKIIWHRVSKVPLKNMDNETIGILGTYDDITNVKGKEEELNKKNEELERFTYTVSHDLKSPLVTIRGFVGLLEEDIGSGDIENVRVNIERIKSAADKMSHLLNNLLELSRIGRFSNPFVRISMSKILKDTLDALAGILQPHKIKVIFPESMPEIFADAQRMTEVWQNLIENAVKFMGDQPNPLIEIGYTSGRKEVEFFIRDNGIGIDANYHDIVFGLFNKLDNKSEGTGFGLALVKRIIEVHGGSISVESEGKGHGTTFRFSIPLLKNKQHE
ncbi:MAG: PAS domain-containing protein, partial [Bacteroidales bacterium]|nr:PAS domain-containing protein [Bacteroidales bacterium]